MVSGLTLVLMASFLIRRINTHVWRNTYVLAVSFLIDIICVSLTVFFDAYNISYILFYILAVDMVILGFSALSAVIAVLSYLSYISIDYYKYIKHNYFDFQYLLPIYVNKSFYFIFIFGAVYITVYQIKSKQTLQKTAEELETKTIQLEEINKKYLETMNALEEVTALKERNRIASEIHDTVGHTLTTVLIEIEAGKRLMNKNAEKALEKFNLAQEQVRKGLNNIRNSVRTLKEGNDILSVIPSLYLLVRETEKHTGVSIKCLFSPLPPITNEMGKILYKALQEGLTNGIRHGQSTEFVCSLSCKEDRVIFLLKDNGKGFDGINFGYGLSTMRERVEETGGSLNICSQKGKGCCLTIEIPCKKGDKGETNQSIDS
jgi:signal transduction histidine kinase